jgi:catechol 2,3-dioxygenase-like lactoylglutathione lyase family enzyme
MMRLDHAIIVVDDLDAARADFTALGFTVLHGGTHASGATQNALIVFADGTYLELMARTGRPPLPGTADYSFLFANGEGFAGLCLSSDDLAADVAAIRSRGGDIADPEGGGRVRPDGVEMRWRSAWIDGQPLPFVMEDLTPRTLRVTDDPAATTHENGATGLIGATVHAGTDALLARFDAVFGASTGFGLGWAEYRCGEARIRLEFGGGRDVLTAVTLGGLDTTVDSHGARLVEA